MLTGEVGKLLHIQVNGEAREAKEGISLVELISELKLKPEQIAVEMNRKVVRRANWETTELSEGDRVEIVHFVGGGRGRGGKQEQDAGAGGRERVLSGPSAVADG